MSYEDNEPLFTRSNLRDVLSEHLKRLSEMVDGIAKDKFQASSDEQIYEHVIDTFVVTPITLHEDKRYMDEPEHTLVDVSGYANYLSIGSGPNLVKGVQVVVRVPYTGDDRLWKLMPDSMWQIHSRGNVERAEEGGHGEVSFIISHPGHEVTHQILETLEDMLRPIRESLRAQKHEIDSKNTALAEMARRAVDERRKELAAHAKIPTSLRIPVRHKVGAPPVTPIRIEKRFPKPLPSTPASKPEPGISDDTYELILKVLRHVGCTFEQTPKTYAVHDEEELRDILLANLNGHFDGGATGETFRKHGKTDIRIEEENRAAFVAECKIWDGASELDKGIDQLQDYLTWRDCRSAIIVFNKKNARFSELQAKVPDVFKSHRGYRSELPGSAAGEWRFSIQSSEDPGRLLTVHVFLFNIFVRAEVAA